MKLNDQYSVKEIAGEKVIILQGRHGADLTKLISLNPTAEFLWNVLSGKEFLVEDIAAALMQEYDIDETTAANDAKKWYNQLKELQLILE